MACFMIWSDLHDEFWGGFDLPDLSAPVDGVADRWRHAYHWPPSGHPGGSSAQVWLPRRRDMGQSRTLWLNLVRTACR